MQTSLQHRWFVVASRTARCWMCVLLLVAMVTTGCASRWQPQRSLQHAVDRGDFALARQIIQKEFTRKPTDRNYILDRLRLGMIDMGDGQVLSAETPLLEMYELLREQGLNDDRTLPSAIAGSEATMIWKGEPFEQAMAYAFFSMQMASLHDWGNARAAANQSLFLLKNFGRNERGQRKTTEDIARAAARAGEVEDYIDHGYTPEPTNFALGYFLNAVANLNMPGMDRRREAEDNFRTAAQYSPQLQSLGEALLEGRANTVMIVAHGKGPEKVRYGYNNAFARFQSVDYNPGTQLAVLVNSQRQPTGTSGLAVNMNELATDHMWNNLQDVRVAMSVLSDAAMISGLVVATQSRQTEVQLAGVGLAVAGALLSSNQQADLRYCEIMPQRFYAVALNITEPDTNVLLQIDGVPASRLLLPDMGPPPQPEQMQLRFAWLPRSTEAQRWAGSGRLHYAWDMDVQVQGDDLPFILGGTCVRPPSAESLAYYQRNGRLMEMTPVMLENLYREEGLYWTVEDQGGSVDRHVLEGGKSLVAPLPGTAGFARLFCQMHRPYPRVGAVRRSVGLAPSVSEQADAIRGFARNDQSPRSLP